MASLKCNRKAIPTWLAIFLVINLSKTSFAQSRIQKIEFFFEQTEGERCNSDLETTPLIFDEAIPDAQQALGNTVDLSGIQQIRVTGSWVLYSEKSYGGKTNVFPYDGCYDIDKTIPTIQSARFLGNSDASLPGLSIFPSQSWPNGAMVYYDETDKEINLASTPICVASWGSSGMWTFYSGPNFSGLSKCRSGWGNNGYFQVYSIKQGCDRSGKMRNETTNLADESQEDGERETRLDLWVSCRPGVIAPISIPPTESTTENEQDVETSTDSGEEKRRQKIEFFFEQTGTDRCNSNSESVSMTFEAPIPDTQQALGSTVDLTGIQQIRVTGSWVLFAEPNYEGKANVFHYDGCFVMDRSIPTIKSARFLGNSNPLLPGLSIFPSQAWPNGPMVYYGEKDTEIDLGFSPICIAAWGASGLWTFYSGPNFSGLSKCRSGWGNNGFFQIHSIKQGCDRSGSEIGATILDGRNETQNLADGETRDEYWISCRPGVIVPITIPPTETSTTENGQDVETSTDSDGEPEKLPQKIEFFFEQSGTDRCNSDSESTSMIFEGPIPNTQEALGSTVDLTGIQQIRVTGAWILYAEPNFQGKTNIFPYDGCYVMDKSIPTILSARFFGNPNSLLPGLSIFPSQPWPNGAMVYYDETATEIDLAFSPICVASWGSTGFWTFFSGPNFSGLSKCRRGWGNNGFFQVYSIKQGCDRSGNGATLLEGKNETQSLAKDSQEDGERETRIDLWVSCRPAVVVPITQEPETTPTAGRTSTTNPEPEEPTSTPGESGGEKTSTSGESGEITSSATEIQESSTANGGVTEDDESTSTTESSASKFQFSTFSTCLVLFVPILSHFY